MFRLSCYLQPLSIFPQRDFTALLPSLSPGNSLKFAPFSAPSSLNPVPRSQKITKPDTHLSIPSRYSSKSSPQMSAKTVEHIVLFKTKPGTEPGKIDAMISGLRGLSSLNKVLHLTAGPISRNRSKSLEFTHLLHSRYIEKDDLSEYMSHPRHTTLVKESILPICDDLMAVDWVADLDGPVVPPWGAMRLTLLKPKDDLGDEQRGEIVRVLMGLKGSFPSIEQVSFGENFSPARAQGFNLCFLSFFPGMNEINALDASQEQINAQKDKIRPLIESLVDVDYAIPLPFAHL